MSNIKAFPGELNPKTILEMAKGWDLEQCVIIGFDVDGLFCIGGSGGKLRDLAFLLKSADIWLTNEMEQNEVNQ